jgi:hypothetical protein
MIRRRSLMVWGAMAALLMGALACAPSVGGLGAQPTATLWVMPTLAPLPGADTGEDSGGGGGEGVSGGLEYPGTDTSSFSSFRSEFTMSWSGTDEAGNPVEGSYTALQAYVTDPPASYTHWDTISSKAGKSGSFEFYQIGDVTYMNSASEGEEPTCIATSQEGDAPEQSPPFSPDTWLAGSDLSSAQVISADENVNGVSATHYRQTHVEGAALAGFETYEVNIWIANDGGYVVRETLIAEGKLITMEVGEGRMEWEYNLLDVNGAVNITPPENCPPPVGADFPKMADADGVTTFGTSLTYSTASPIADVVAFYNEQLPGLGWTAGTESTDVAGMATMAFTREGVKATLVITEVGGKTSVRITFEELEG